jgi:hypothetical protein
MNSTTQEPSNDTLERINRQLSIIEQVIERLTADMEMAELDKLPPSTRLSLMAKFMEQHSRTLRLRNTCGKEDSMAREREIVKQMMRQIGIDDET